jgi:hypothetical protein
MPYPANKGAQAQKGSARKQKENSNKKMENVLWKAF